MERYSGVEIEVGGRKLILPPLSLGVAIRMDEDIKRAISGDMQPGEALQFALRVVHAALQRNYPEMSIEEVGEFLDMGNWRKLSFTALQAAGYENKGAGEGKVDAGSQ